MIDPSGNWSIKGALKKAASKVVDVVDTAKDWAVEHKEQIIETAKIVAVAAVLTVAVVATAGAAGAAIGAAMGMAALGTSVSVSTAIAVGTYATYAVAGTLIAGKIATSASDIGEVWTGKNVGKKLI